MTPALGTLKGRHGLYAEIVPDYSPENPRTEWDNAAVFVIRPNRYVGGDKESAEYADISNGSEVYAAIKAERAPVAILPIHMLVHGETRLSTAPFGDAWDSGQCGWAFVPGDEDEEREYSQEEVAAAEAVIRSELATYDHYINGEVYGFAVKDADGEVLDSCCGFFGYDYAMEEARGSLEHECSRLDRGAHPPLPGLEALCA